MGWAAGTGAPLGMVRFSADLITAGLLMPLRVKVGVETTFEEGYDPLQNKAIGMGRMLTAPGSGILMAA